VLSRADRRAADDPAPLPIGLLRARRVAKRGRVGRDRGDACTRAGERVATLVDQHRLDQHLVTAEHHLQSPGRLECLAKRRVPVTADNQVVQHLALDTRIESGVVFDVGVHVAHRERAACVGAEDIYGGDAVGVRPAPQIVSSRALSAAVAFSRGMRRPVAMKPQTTVARPRSCANG
jgi:hypothetical protein